MPTSDRTDAAIDGAGPRQGRQRLDKWLWFARVARTRSAAARLVSAGHVRVNSRRIGNPAKPVAVGDVLTVALERDVRVLKVVAPGLRRGPFREACDLFEDLSESAGKGAPPTPGREAQHR